MKKNVFFILSVISAVFMLTGCAGNDEPFTQKAYESGKSQIEGIHIDVLDRWIEVAQSEDDQVHISYFESSKEGYDISVSQDNILSMTVKNNKEWTDYFGGKADADSRKISLQVPEALLTELTIATTNEDIKFSPLTVKENISISAKGGNIIFEQLNPGNTLNLTAKNGNISGTILGSCDDTAITCKIKKGESNLPSAKDTGSKTLNVSVNNGDVDVTFVQE